MSLIKFDSDNKIHQELFDAFKKDLISEAYSKSHLQCNYNGYIEPLTVAARNIAIEDLGFDEDFDEECSFSIQNSLPDQFTLITSLEFIDYESDEVLIDYIKFGGQIMIENNEEVILDIDNTSIDYSNSKAFNKNNNHFLSLR